MANEAQPSVGFDLFDQVSGNAVDSFETREEALAFVRLIANDAAERPLINDWVLQLVHTETGTSQVVARGESLLRLADESAPGLGLPTARG